MCVMYVAKLLKAFPDVLKGVISSTTLAVPFG